MRVTSQNGQLLDVRFFKNHRTVEKSRFKGRTLVDTVCVISEVIKNSENDKATFKEIVKDVARQSPKEVYNKYLGKKVSLQRALSKSDLDPYDREGLLFQFETEFSHCKK